MISDTVLSGATYDQIESAAKRWYDRAFKGKASWDDLTDGDKAFWCAAMHQSAADIVPPGYVIVPEAESALLAIEASGRVTVDRARFERIWNVAVAAHEELSEEAGYGGSGTTGTCAAVEWLQPGDLEPLA